MKKLHFILIIFIVLLAPDVFAQEVNVTNNCYGSTGYSGMYNGQEVQYQTYNPYNFGTTYQYQLSSFETELRYNLSANTTYTVTINTNNTNDFRNNFRTYNVYDLDHNDNNLVQSFTYVSMKKVQIIFKTTVATSRVQIQMGGSNVYDNITGETNWNIKSVILTIPDNAPSGSTNQDIIDNQTNNTNNIINNNNQNTSNIINNNNQNTQQIIDSNNVCRELSINDAPFDGFLDYLGDFYEQYGYNKTTDYISVEGINKIVLLRKANTNKFACFYTLNKTTINCIDTSTLANNSTIDIPSNAYFFRSNFEVSDKLPVYSLCGNGNQAISDSIDKVNDSINNSNVESSTGQGFFDDFTSQDFGLSQIITIPLNTIQGLTSKSCVPLQVPIPFTNSNLTLPCMTEIYQNKMPTIYNLWKIVSFGIVAYLIAIDIFHIVKGFKDPESDKVEVLDL